MENEELERFVMAAEEDVVPPTEITEQFRSMPFSEYKRLIYRHYRELNRIAADELLALFERNGFAIVWHERRRSTEPIPVARLN